MAQSAHSVRPLHVPVISYDALEDPSTEYRATHRSLRPRIHPVLFLASLLTAGILCALSIGAILEYAPPAHSPHSHDELFILPGGRHYGDGEHAPELSAPVSSRASTSWNSIATVLGGFSTTFVTAPALNISWTARPAGFGPHIVGDKGFLGKLQSIAHGHTIEGDDDSLGFTMARRGCHIPETDGSGNGMSAISPEGSSDTKKANRLPLVALIERGDCPFIRKLLNAQALGYSGAIVHNDAAHSTHSRQAIVNKVYPESEDEDEELISMWSPSREASKLEIPSVFVSYTTGSALESLIALSENNGESWNIVIEAEEPPHILIMDIIVALFFLPTIFTTIVLILTKVRQVRHRARQRAPQSLVDSLPSFMWREGLELDLESSTNGEKDPVSSVSGQPSMTLPEVKSAGMDRRIVRILTSALKRPAPPGNGISARHTVLPESKAKHIARKIFQQKECAICLGDFLTDERVRLLPCGHIFHQLEIDAWLTQQKRWCPVCRFSIDEEDDKGEAGRQSLGASATAQPIALLEDPQEGQPPVASSSTTINERTPLLVGGAR